MAGTLDKTFGTNNQGWSATTFNDKNSVGISLVTNAGGEIFVVGTTGGTTGGEKGFATLIIAKYKSNGVLDTSWGINGYVSTIFYSSNFLSGGKPLVIDDSGNIFVTGHRKDNSNQPQLIVAKYTKNGQLANDFGTGNQGWTASSFNTTRSTGFSLVLNIIGNIFVIGYAGDKLLVAKYTNSGILANDFGDGNQGWTASTFGVDGSIGISLVLDIRGNIFVTGGKSVDSKGNSQLIVAKYTSRGILANDFGTDGFGWTVGNFYSGKFSSGNSLVIDNSDNGNIFVTGYTFDNFNKQKLIVAKYTSTGTLDTTFGTNGLGWVIGNFNTSDESIGISLVLDTIGNIFVTGSIGGDTVNIETLQLILAKYTSSGILDTSFGSDGWTVGNFYTGQPSSGVGLLLGANGGIIVVGFTGSIDGTIDQLLLAKYLNPNIEPICLPAGTPILTDQGTIPIDLIDPEKHTIANHRIVAITRAITPEKYLVCFEANSIGINCPSKRTLMTPGHEVLYKGKLVQAKHFIGRVDGVHSVPYNGKDILYNVLQERHGLMKVNNMVLETLHPENKVAKALLQ